MRAMALYDWLEECDLAKLPEFVLELVHDLDIAPTKAGFNVTVNRWRRRTIYKQSNLLKVIAEFPSYSSFELCRPIRNDFNNFEADMQYSTHLGNSYFVALPPENLPLSKLVNHVRLFCRHMTPRYGFSHVMEGSGSTYFLGGIATTSMNYDDRQRASDLGHSLSRNFGREHLQGRLHDIYELNVLSPAHMQRETFGTTLASWISSGARGELVEVNKVVSVWLVPEAIRPRLRKSFFDAGLLIATN